MAAWYETQSCALCGKTVGKRRFWQDKPRLVGRDTHVRDCAHIDEETARTLLGDGLKLVCHDCYLHRFGDVQRLARGEQTT